MFKLENVAYDLDDTSLDFVNPFVLFNNDLFGNSLTKDDFKTYDFCKVCKCSQQEMNMRMIKFAESDYAEKIIPIDGARRILQFFKDIGRTMIVVTGRGNHLREMTARSVGNHFDGFFSGIYHARSYTQPTKSVKPKSEICLEQKANLIFEDYPKHIIDCAKAGIKVIVLDQPWNRVPLPDGVIRMKSWYEVPRIMYEISK